MWIINDNTATRRLFNDDLVDGEDEPVLDEPVQFNENGTAQVSEDVGEALCDHYDDIRPYEANED